MYDDKPAARAASAILRRLQAQESVETERPEELVREIVEALDRYEHAVDALVTSVLSSASSLAIAQGELDRRAVAGGVPLDDDALPPLLAKICTLLLESEHVEELFVDDAELAKIVRAALLDYLPSVASQERSKLAAAFVKPRPKPPASQKLASIADDGYLFPLFEGPLESAVADDAGPCAFCATPSEVRFARACFACFRAGKAVAHVVGTELGMVRAEDAAVGLTHGVPVSLAPPGHERVDVPAEDGHEPWVRLRVDAAALNELLRTPRYETWQGESWLFCCQKPMVFMGPMREALLERLREPEQTQEEVVAKLLQVNARDAHRRTAEVLAGRISMYVFRCASCAKRRAHWDSA